MTYEEELQAAIDQDTRKLEQMVDIRQRRIDKAIGFLSAMIDGGEECRGRVAEISDVIRILEGEA